MEVLEAIKGRRSIRQYKSDLVDDQTLERVLEAARQAPSWANTQCWRFVVVRDAAIKDRLITSLKGVRPDAKNAAAEAMKQAPLAIVACAEMGKSGYYRGQRMTEKGDWYLFDVALAMQNLALAAHSLGLGTVHIGLFDDAKVASLLGVPEGFSVVSMTPLGYPDQAPNPVPRKELAEIVSYDRWGA